MRITEIRLLVYKNKYDEQIIDYIVKRIFKITRMGKEEDLECQPQ